jgi:hypothetical protein
MFMTYVEVKYGLLAIVLIGAGLFAMVMLISGAPLLVREIGRTIKRWRIRRAAAVRPAERANQNRLYSGAGD